MARIWPFFQTMLGNMERVLAKSDMALASRYAELVQDQEAAHAIFARIREGWQQTHDGLLAITGQSRLLDTNPTLDRSIRLRLPYIEPLNLLQTPLLKRHRSGDDAPRKRAVIALSTNAIATVLRKDRKGAVCGKRVMKRIDK